MNGQQILQLVMAHKIGAAALAFLATGAGANLLARAINAIPLAWWFSMVKGWAFALGAAGDLKLGQPVFQPFEDLILRVAQGTADSIRDGFNAAEDAGAQKQAPVVLFMASRSAAPTSFRPDVEPTPQHPSPSLELQADKPSPLTPKDGDAPLK